MSYADDVCKRALLAEVEKLRPMLSEVGERNFKALDENDPIRNRSLDNLKSIVNLLARSV